MAKSLKNQKQSPMPILVVVLVIAGLFLACQNRLLNNQVASIKENTPNEIRKQIVLGTVKQLPEVISYSKLVNDKGYHVTFDVKETGEMPTSFAEGTTFYEVWVYESRDEYLTRFNTYLVPVNSYIVDSESILKLDTVSSEWIAL